MRSGIYEKLLDNTSKKEIEQSKYKKIKNIDNSEVSRVVSTSYQKIIRETLSSLKDDRERVEVIKKLDKTIGIEAMEQKNQY